MNYDKDYDVLLKMMLIGDSSVGKSVLMKTYVDGIYTDDSYVSTIGVDFNIKNVVFNDDEILDENARLDSTRAKSNQTKVKLQIWDTAGQERFRAVTRSYYRGMKICILCFDAGKNGSLGSVQNLTKWLDSVKEFSHSGTYVYVLGMRIDMRTINNFITKSIADEIAQKIEEYGKINPEINVKFLGWCSSKKNIFLKDLSDIDRVGDSLMGIYRWKDSDQFVPSISDMFEEIATNHLNDNKNRTDRTGQVVKVDIINDKKSCCSIV